MKTFVDQQSYTAWLDSLYHKDTKEKHFLKIQKQSVDTDTVLGRYLSSPTRTDVKQLLPTPWKNSDPQTIGELRAIQYVQNGAGKEQIDFAIRMEDLREHYSWWDREVFKLTGEGYGYNYFFNLAERGDGFINYLKIQYLRIRPFELSDAIDFGIRRLIDNPRTGSYPSGHAFDAWVFAYHLTERHPELKATWESMAKRIGETRMINGVHFPSDIEAGRMAALIAKQIDDAWVATCDS